jgi:hypothetical protein
MTRSDAVHPSARSLLSHLTELAESPRLYGLPEPVTSRELAYEAMMFGGSWGTLARVAWYWLRHWWPR